MSAQCSSRAAGQMWLQENLPTGPATSTANLLARLPCSGITGGKFLERGKVYKQGSKLVRAVALPDGKRGGA